MRRKLVTGFAVCASLVAWAGPTAAAFISSAGPVIAIIAGDLFLGEAEGNLDGSGTIRIRSHLRPGVTCNGQFTSSAEQGGAGNMRCSDGATARYRFQRLSIMRGHGTGSSSRGALSFTYGLSADESAPYLTLPPGKALKMGGKGLALVDIMQPGPVIFPVKISIASSPEIAPDVLLSAATMVVTARLKQEKDLQTDSPGKIAELIESMILPLFDFRRMTQLAVARHWRLASSEQQSALIFEFRALLVRTYSTALTNYHDQTIEYQALRAAPGATDVTVKSIVKQSSAEPMTIDYEMEKNIAGWKVYDIKISGISLVTTYRSTFDRMIRDDGVEGLIKSLSAKNRLADSGSASDERVTRSAILLYTVIPSVLRGGF